MPRNPQDVALDQLRAAVKNLEASTRAAQRNALKVEAAMVKAVIAGDAARDKGQSVTASRHVVAKIANVSTSWISRIPGMPPGKNAAKNSQGVA